MQKAMESVLSLSLSLNFLSFLRFSAGGGGLPSPPSPKKINCTHNSFSCPSPNRLHRRPRRHQTSDNGFQKCLSYPPKMSAKLGKERGLYKGMKLVSGWFNGGSDPSSLCDEILQAPLCCFRMNFLIIKKGGQNANKRSFSIFRRTFQSPNLLFQSSLRHWNYFQSKAYAKQTKPQENDAQFKSICKTSGQRRPIQKQIQQHQIGKKEELQIGQKPHPISKTRTKNSSQNSIICLIQTYIYYIQAQTDRYIDAENFLMADLIRQWNELVD